MDDAPKPRKGKRKLPAPAPGPQKGPQLVPDTSDVDPARRAKIEKIKQALADGTYRIPNEDVARKVIDHMRDPKS